MSESVVLLLDMENNLYEVLAAGQIIYTNSAPEYT